MHLPEQISEIFFKKFGRKNELLVRASGRINIIGEHTDYNDGFVLPVAVDKYIYFAAARNNANICRIWAEDIQQFAEVQLDAIQPGPKLWANYLYGIIDQFQQLGNGPGGLDLAFGGNLPIGSGMSSSAAMEVGMATVLRYLFEVEIEKMDIARLARRSSRQFIGVPVGIMDQFASIMGKKDHVMRLDCRSLDYDYIPFFIGDYQVVMVNSRVSHSLASSEYGARVKECEAGVQLMRRFYPEVSSLRDISMDQLAAHRADFPELIYRRCHYVVAENDRVLQACRALQSGDILTLGLLLNDTHAGLRDEYQVSAPELDFLVQFAQDQPGVAGARIMGGGFGGCSINLVKKDQVSNFTDAVLRAYQTEFNILGETYEVSAVDGTRPILLSV